MGVDGQVGWAVGGDEGIGINKKSISILKD